MKRNANYKGCLFCAMLILCQACQTSDGRPSFKKDSDEAYTATIEYIYLNRSPYGGEKDSILDGVYVHVNVQNSPKYVRHLWVGNKRKENVGGFLYMVHQRDTFRFDCRHYVSNNEEEQYTHSLNVFSDDDYGNGDFERLQRILKSDKDNYKEFLADFFKETEFYVMPDSVSFAKYIRRQWGNSIDIGYPKRSISVKRKVPFILGIGEESDYLESHYEDWIIIYPDSILYKRAFIGY